ncbi:hypothetical protein Unana1_04111 [Umbelopsis nana]
MKFSILALTAFASVATADYFSVNFMAWGNADAPTGAVTSNYVNPTVIDDATGNTCNQGGLLVIDNLDWVYYQNCTSGVAAHFGLVPGKSELAYVLNGNKEVYPCLAAGTGSSPATFTNYLCSKTFTLPKNITLPKLPAPQQPDAAALAAAATKTVAPTANPTCTSGYSGKKNGGGPTGACCTSSDDCHANCINGSCKLL